MRPHGRRARVSPQNPVALAQCDRCGCWVNRTGLIAQMQWGGTKLYSTQILVCEHCYDIPQPQLRTIILPPDPPSVLNARVPNFGQEENTPRIIQFPNPRGAAFIAQYPYGAGVPFAIRATQGTQFNGDDGLARILDYGTTQPTLPS